jgi:hypothetical protein
VATGGRTSPCVNAVARRAFGARGTVTSRVPCTASGCVARDVAAGSRVCDGPDAPRFDLKTRRGSSSRCETPSKGGPVDTDSVCAASKARGSSCTGGAGAWTGLGS